MASFSATLVALRVASCATVAAATTFDVGDGHGWDIGVDYPAWTIGKTFAVGDTLVFNYTSKAHTVTEVDESGFDDCSGVNSLSNDDSGATTVTLATAGVHYFICNVPGHCASGMKLAVTAIIVAAIPAGDAGVSSVPATSHQLDHESTPEPCKCKPYGSEQNNKNISTNAQHLPIQYWVNSKIII